MKPGRLLLMGGLLAALAACANPFGSEQGTITLPNGDEVTFPLDRGRGQVTLDAESFVAIIETRSRNGNRPFCGGFSVPGGALPTPAAPYYRASDAPGVGAVWAGYFNSREGRNERCESRYGRNHHVVVEFDEGILTRIIAEASRARGEPMRANAVSATLRLERKATPVEDWERCIIGRRSPLRSAIFDDALISVIDAPVGTTFSTVARVFTPPESRPDLQIITYPEGFYAGDGRRFTMGFDEYHLQTPQVALIEEEPGADGTTLFIFANDAGLEELNSALSQAELNLGATLFGVANSEYGTNRACAAVYRNIRLNIEYELLSAS